MNLSTLSKLTEDEAREMLESIMWPNGPVCPHCGSIDGHTKFNGKKHRPGLWKCNAGCGQQFTVTVKSVMEGPHLPIRTWLMAFSIFCSAKKSVSALQLQRQLGLGSYRSAWHLAHRIRHAMQQEPLKGLLQGVVIADETYVGGKPRKFARKAFGKPPSNAPGRGTSKQPVLALVERGGRVRAGAVPDVTGKTLKTAIREIVDKSATIMTDEWRAYRGLGKEFAAHYTVNHSKLEYVRHVDGEKVSTNEGEAFFALFKRGIVGSFHHISRKHINRYCDEFAYRWSERKTTDAERTVKAIRAASGKRLMYKTPMEDKPY